jgi:hypothetical protein
LQLRAKHRLAQSKKSYILLFVHAPEEASIGGLQSDRFGGSNLRELSVAQAAL